MSPLGRGAPRCAPPPLRCTVAPRTNAQGETVDKKAYARLSVLRDEFKRRVAAWTEELPDLLGAQEELIRELGEDDYPLQTPIVYNRALDDIGPGDSIDWIVVADNPGKREQEAAMNRYLVGQSGRTMENFFLRELGCELRKRTLIINKTPVHTPKTIQLRALRSRHPGLRSVLDESQRYMAGLALELHAALGAKLWIMGLSELKPSGIFAPWLEAFSVGAREAGAAGYVHAFNHFSMGSFATDLKRRLREGEPVPEAVARIGRENSYRVFGF